MRPGLLGFHEERPLLRLLGPKMGQAFVMHLAEQPDPPVFQAGSAFTRDH